ncbi:phage tail tape measure protein [Pseudomonas sp. HMWF006]|uniref:phage tail tape measure protein n=1 Tax=Pseudomonas sp. HMWF006 TaxID=2056843 RepID=UPI000D467A87|nr:phage tail tape measure protein [Pseudomonas sp. HMWF006]PTS99318.1 phage tail tape measure protein [Pseudomonas sp. HMWF006]PTT66643.1 phage tail tape measure protein [Pseudomonas sp. HMWF007]
MAENKYALTYAGESGNTTGGLALLDNLGKPLRDLNLTLALASNAIRLLTQEQIKLRELLVSQQSLFKVVAAAPAANSEPKSKLKAEIEQSPPPKSLQSSMASETALVELNQLIGLNKEQLQAHSEQTLELATQRPIAASGATGADLLQVQQVGARSGIADGTKGDQRAAELRAYSGDAAINATAFRMDVKAAGEMLAVWRSSLKLDRYQGQDLADAISYLGSSGLDAKAADIGSVVQRSGESAVASGMTPEQVAAFATALLNSGADKDGASAALKSFASVFGKENAASTEQRSAMTRLQLDPESLREKMRTDAPGAIDSVLVALNQQSGPERAATAKTLFGESGASILELLKKPDDVKTAFTRVSDKHDYATSELGSGGGAATKTAEAFGDTSQGRWNALDASLNRLTTAFGTALAPLTDALAVGLTAVVNVASTAAEAFPALTAGLVVLGAVTLPFVTAALKSGAAAVIGAVTTKLLRLASTRLPPEIGDVIGGDEDADRPRKKKKSSRSPARQNPAKAPSRSVGGSRLRGVTARVLPLIDNAKIGLEMWADKIGSWTPRSIEKMAARQVPAVQRLGASLMPRLAQAMPALKLGAPLALAHAAYTGLKGWREGDDQAVKGAAGELAGTAIGAAIGTFIAPGIGTYIGGAVGSYLGQKWGETAEDKLAPPAQVAKELSSAQTQNPQYTYAPVVQVSGSDALNSEKIGAVVAQVIRNHFDTGYMPAIGTNPLATRRDAALSDGVA